MDTPLYTQQNRLFTVTTPLGPDQLLFHSLQGEERLSDLFHFRLELRSESKQIAFSNLVGQPLTVTIGYAPNQQRYFHGIVTRFEQAGTFVHPGGTARFTVYYADLRPWLWQLTLTKNSRIFQHRSVPETIKQVFNDLGFTDYRDALIHSYEPRVYCVQYAETAFQFVCRLMEDEGIFYFFEHTADQHTLVLADDLNAHRPCPGIPTARFLTVAAAGEQPEDAVTECQFIQQLTTGQYAVDDFNFETPSANLETSLTGAGENPPRVYEYAAGFTQSSQGEKKARVRLESHTADLKLLEGNGHCFSFTAGHRFQLTDHPRADLNQEYVLRTVSHSLSAERYTNHFQAHPHETPYRPQVATPKPQIVSTQTAIVVGPAGEEIYTDNYGRIKVQFHWDQEGQYNENSSCWIRVNQGWAGKGWGSIWIPRIGQEVIVSFLNGNPDAPMVTGAVYNAEQVVPYPLPGEQTKSTVKSNSTKGGQGFNEIRFEDKKGQEEIYIHAQRDQNEVVRRNMSTSVGSNQSLTVGHNRTKTVKNDETSTIEHDLTQTVKNNETLVVEGTHTQTITKDTTIKIETGMYLHDVLENTATYHVKGDVSEFYESNQVTMVDKEKKVEVGVNSGEVVGKLKVVDAGEKIYLHCGENKVTIEKTGDITIDATQKIQLHCGGSKVTIENSGKVTITGTDFDFNATGTVTIKGGPLIKLDSSLIKLNC